MSFLLLTRKKYFYRLSGYSPFVGDTDLDTMTNVTLAQWDFKEEAFANISNEAKDFIKNLLIKDGTYVRWY